MQKLKRMLTARRVAVVGASPEQLSVGLGPLHNLLAAPFDGEVFPVNPKYDSILGIPCYPGIESIDPPVDLAILLLNQNLALEIAVRAARHGVAGVTIVAGGFKEVAAGGKQLEERLRHISLEFDLPVVGPNTLGFSVFQSGLHGIFWHLDTFPGKVAILSQSGGVGLTMAYALRSLHCGLSHFIGVGNRTVLDFSDYLEALEDHLQVGCLLLFVEGVDNPRDLYEGIRRAARRLPVVVYKAGKNEEVSRATATHTGSLTGEYRLYRAMFKQAGAVEVDSTWDAAVVSKAFSMLQRPVGRKLCALTFTAGPCIVAMDRLVTAGWELPALRAGVRDRIRSLIGEKTPVEIQNPVDLTGPGFLPTTYVPVLESVLREDFDAYFLVWNYNPLIRVPVVEMAELIRRNSQKPAVVVLLAHHKEAEPFMQRLAAAGVCTFLTPEDGATALNALLMRSNFLRRGERS
jgi:acyl-CoA synthetase (NDP forming)